MNIQEEIESACYRGLDDWASDLSDNANGSPSRFMADYEDHKDIFISELRNKIQESISLEEFCSKCESTNELGYHLADNLNNIDFSENISWLECKGCLSNSLDSIESYRRDFST